jgi:carbon monoxide dehydrogenase subunit G
VAYNFNGDFTVATPRDEVFAVLSQTEKFAPLMPTYKSHALKEDGSADVSVKVGVGKVRGTGKVNLTLEESQEPVRAKYHGKGEVMGGAFNIVAAFELEDAGQDRTRVNWEGELAIFGKLVSLAGGLVKPVAERDINKMIEALQLALGGAEEVVVVEPRRGIIARFIEWLKSLFKGGAAKENQVSENQVSENQASDSQASDASRDEG